MSTTFKRQLLCNVFTVFFSLFVLSHALATPRVHTKERSRHVLENTYFILVPFVDISHMVDFQHLSKALVAMGVPSQHVFILNLNEQSYEQLEKENSQISTIRVSQFAPSLNDYYQSGRYNKERMLDSLTSDKDRMAKYNTAMTFFAELMAPTVKGMDEFFQNHPFFSQVLNSNTNGRKKILFVLDAVFSSVVEWIQAQHPDLEFVVMLDVPMSAYSPQNEMANILARRPYESTGLEKGRRILKSEGLWAYVKNRLYEKVYKFGEFMMMVYPKVRTLDEERIRLGLSPIGMPFVLVRNKLLLYFTLPGFGYVMDVPPNCRMIGFTTTPKRVRNDKSTMDEELKNWLQNRSNLPSKVVFIAFGTKGKLSLEHTRLFISQVLDAKRHDGNGELVTLNLLIAHPSYTVLSDIFPQQSPQFKLYEKRVLIRKWVNQPMILQHYASVFITHGGAHSIFESIETNTPLIVYPQFADQFLNAIHAEDHFIARSVYSPQEVSQALDDILEHETEYKERLMRWNLKNKLHTKPYLNMLQNNSSHEISGNVAFAAYEIIKVAHFGNDDMISIENKLSWLEQLDVVKLFLGIGITVVIGPLVVMALFCCCYKTKESSSTASHKVE